MVVLVVGQKAGTPRTELARQTRLQHVPSWSATTSVMLLSLTPLTHERNTPAFAAAGAGDWNTSISPVLSLARTVTGTVVVGIDPEKYQMLQLARVSDRLEVAVKTVTFVIVVPGFSDCSRKR